MNHNTIGSTIKVNENLTSTFSKINKVMDKTINNFNQMEKAAKGVNADNFNKIDSNLANMNKKQEQFNSKIKQSSKEVDNLAQKIKAAVTAFAGIYLVDKAINFIKKSLEAQTIQANAELQLQVALKNMGAADNAFDVIKKKASEIQTAGIFGDEGMIAGAAELATYMKDAKAITKMMDTLSNYAAGMSGGKEVNTEQMVNYATNLGKVLNGSYDAMTKKGFQFNDAQKAIIDGTATESQYVQVLGANYRDLSEDMMKAETVAQVINQSWGNLYETISNTPTGKIIQLKNLFGDIMEEVGQKLSPSITEFMNVILTNIPLIRDSLLSIADILSPMISTLSTILEVVGNVANQVYTFLQTVFPGFESMIGVISGVAIAVTALGAAFSFLVSPIGLVIAAVLGVVLAINYVINNVSALTGKSISAAGVIAAAFMMLYAVIHNIIARIWDIVASLAEFLINVWNDPIAAIKIVFANLVSDIANVVADVVSVIGSLAATMADVILGAINLVIKGWNKLIDLIGEGVASKIGLGKGDLIVGSAQNAIKDTVGNIRNFANKSRDYANSLKDENYITVDRMGTMSLDDAYQKGYNFGSGLEDKLGQTTQNITGSMANIMQGVADNTSETANNTDGINDKLSTAEEDLKYMRDLAERETINKFTTAEIKVDMTNNNAINSEMDIDGVVNVLTEKLNEQLNTQVIGVYNY